MENICKIMMFRINIGYFSLVKLVVLYLVNYLSSRGKILYKQTINEI